VGSEGVEILRKLGGEFRVNGGLGASLEKACRKDDGRGVEK